MRPMDGQEIEPARLQRLQAKHEQLKKNPEFRMLGEGPGKVNVSKAFAHRLSELTPTQRRLALAKACAQPWRDELGAMPECYRRDLDHATYEAREEHKTCCGSPFDPDCLFEGEAEPIASYLLRQLAEMTPADRRSSLFRVISGCWNPDHSADFRARAAVAGIDLGEPEDLPEWVRREVSYSWAEWTDERRAYLPPVAHTGERVTAEQGARELEAELNRTTEG